MKWGQVVREEVTAALLSIAFGIVLWEGGRFLRKWRLDKTLEESLMGGEMVCARVCSDRDQDGEEVDQVLGESFPGVRAEMVVNKDEDFSIEDFYGKTEDILRIAERRAEHVASWMTRNQVGQGFLQIAIGIHRGQLHIRSTKFCVPCVWVVIFDVQSGTKTAAYCGGVLSRTSSAMKQSIQALHAIQLAWESHFDSS